MTLRDRDAFLWDMLQAARNIKNFIGGSSLEDYRSNDLLRSAVERQFLVIGEAASQCARRFPELEEEIGDIERIIAFRNRLAHGYAVISDDVVWAIAHDELPRLRDDIQRLIGDAAT